jgi:hypothetical protein
MMADPQEDVCICTQCGRSTECCSVCELTDCGEMICYRCLRIALGQSVPVLHEHGG